MSLKKWFVYKAADCCDEPLEVENQLLMAEPFDWVPSA
jgi:hypothetical protein